MVNKLPPLKGQYLIQYCLTQVVNQVCDCELVSQNNADEMPDYPYVTFFWVSPENDVTSDYMGDSQQYTCTLQIDCHATESYQAMQLSQALHKALLIQGYKRYFTQANVVPENVSNTSNRTALQGINYDHDYGFDCSFLVTGNKEYQLSDLKFNYEDYDIKSIKINSTNLGGDTEINLPKEDK